MAKFGDYTAASGIDGTEIILMKKDGETVRTTLDEVISALVSAPDVNTGTFTGTTFGEANCSIVSTNRLNWKKVGDMVTVFGAITVNGTAAGPAAFALNLPVSSNLTYGVMNGGGNGLGLDTAANYISVLISPNSGAPGYLQFNFTVVATGAITISFNVSYLIN